LPKILTVSGHFAFVNMQHLLLLLLVVLLVLRRDNGGSFTTNGKMPEFQIQIQVNSRIFGRILPIVHDLANCLQKYMVFLLRKVFLYYVSTLPIISLARSEQRLGVVRSHEQFRIHSSAIGKIYPCSIH